MGSILKDHRAAILKGRLEIQIQNQREVDLGAAPSTSSQELFLETVDEDSEEVMISDH